MEVGGVEPPSTNNIYQKSFTGLFIFSKITKFTDLTNLSYRSQNPPILF